MPPLPPILRHPSVNPDEPSAVQLRWDSRYQQGCTPGHDKASTWLLAHEHLLTGGRALDVACGKGRHSLWLLRLGYRVDAVDISAAGLQVLAQRAQEMGFAERLRLTQADLRTWRPAAKSYDLVLMTRYLNRALWPALIAALKPEGLLIYRSFHIDLHRLRPDFQLDHMLQPGELLLAFSGLEMLAYEERRLSADSSDSEDCTASIIVRRPPSFNPENHREV